MEATKWQDANFIGTLAAAFAEAGDFKKAVEQANRSLKMAWSEPALKREMEHCLALFQRNRAYRQDDASEILLTSDDISSPGSLAGARFRISIETATADELNELAWRLATSPKRSEDEMATKRFCTRKRRAIFQNGGMPIL